VASPLGFPVAEDGGGGGLSRRTRQRAAGRHSPLYLVSYRNKKTFTYAKRACACVKSVYALGMQKRINLSIDEQVHADGVALAADRGQTFSALVSELLRREVAKAARGRPASRENKKEVPVVVAKAAVPRNAPCPCGSGSKFKRCCGA